MPLFNHNADYIGPMFHPEYNLLATMLNRTNGRECITTSRANDRAVTQKILNLKYITMTTYTVLELVDTPIPHRIQKQFVSTRVFRLCVKFLPEDVHVLCPDAAKYYEQTLTDFNMIVTLDPICWYAAKFDIYELQLREKTLLHAMSRLIADITDDGYKELLREFVKNAPLLYYSDISLQNDINDLHDIFVKYKGPKPQTQSDLTAPLDITIPYYNDRLVNRKKLLMNKMNKGGTYGDSRRKSN